MTFFGSIPLPHSIASPETVSNCLELSLQVVRVMSSKCDLCYNDCPTLVNISLCTERLCNICHTLYTRKLIPLFVSEETDSRNRPKNVSLRPFNSAQKCIITRFRTKCYNPVYKPFTEESSEQLIDPHLIKPLLLLVTNTLESDVLQLLRESISSSETSKPKRRLTIDTIQCLGTSMSPSSPIDFSSLGQPVSPSSTVDLNQLISSFYRHKSCHSNRYSIEQPRSNIALNASLTPSFSPPALFLPSVEDQSPGIIAFTSEITRSQIDQDSIIPLLLEDTLLTVDEQDRLPRVSPVHEPLLKQSFSKVDPANMRKSRKQHRRRDQELTNTTISEEQQSIIDGDDVRDNDRQKDNERDEEAQHIETQETEVEGDEVRNDEVQNGQTENDKAKDNVARSVELSRALHSSFSSVHNRMNKLHRYLKAVNGELDELREKLVKLNNLQRDTLLIFESTHRKVSTRRGYPKQFASKEHRHEDPKTTNFRNSEEHQISLDREDARANNSQNDEVEDNGAEDDEAEDDEVGDHVASSVQQCARAAHDTYSIIHKRMNELNRYPRGYKKEIEEELGELREELVKLDDSHAPRAIH